MIYLLLFIEFFKIGLFTVGGGYAMIPLIKEVVFKYGWISEELFYDFLGIAESTPGPFAINIATFIGQTQGGLLGSILSVTGLILPSIIIILIIASILSKFSDNKIYKRIFKGIKVVVASLILATGLVLCLKSLGFINFTTFNFDYKLLIIFILLVGLILLYKYVFKKNCPTLLLIFVSAILGIIVNII